MSADLDFQMNDPATEQKSGSNKTLIILLVLLNLMAMGGFGYYVLADHKADTEPSAESVVAAQPLEVPAKVVVGPIVANTNIESDYQYAQVSVVLVTKSNDLQAVVDANEFKVQALIASQLRLASDEMLLTEPGLIDLKNKIESVLREYLVSVGFDVKLLDEIILVNAIVE